MKPLKIRPCFHLKGKINFLGDKSIAHRYIIISALATGKTRIENFPANQDCFFTLNALKQLGVSITKQYPNSHNLAVCTVEVTGVGLSGLQEPKKPVFTGESGTTFRLLLGILAGQAFSAKLVSGRSLSKRPMLRVTSPLRLMGAVIKAKVKSKKSPAIQCNSRRDPACSGIAWRGKVEEYPPITIRGGNLRPIKYNMPVASAQVKSAILLAALYAQGKTEVVEQVKTRDHTERALKLFGAEIKHIQNQIVIKGMSRLRSPGVVSVPGDISSAAFFIVLAALATQSHLIMENVSLNPARIGVLKALSKMGARIKIVNFKPKVYGAEPIGNIVVRNSNLNGIIIEPDEIPSLIDELPILMVAASLAKGRTLFKGVNELRVKETDRVKSMLVNLTKMGARISIIKEGNTEHISIEGVKRLSCAKLKSYGDHRTAMSMIVAGTVASGQSVLDDVSCINKSFPNFLGILQSVVT